MVKYKLSGFIYGMGTAIVVLSLIYYVVYNLDLRKKIKPVDLHNSISYEDEPGNELDQPLTETQIEDLARGIGMVFPSELNDSP